MIQIPTLILRLRVILSAPLGEKAVRYGPAALVPAALVLLLARGAAGPPSVPLPILRIDATKLGFTPAYFEPDREFFKNYTPAKLAAADPESKLTMLSESAAALYATRPGSGLSKHEMPCLQAFFIDVSTGSLLRKQEWHVRPRQGSSDNFDSEARVIGLSGGKYLVMANAKLYLYTADGTLSGTKALSEGIWAAKSVSGGEVIFLRHQRYRGKDVEYLWLDSGTLETQRRFEDGDGVRIQMPYSGTADSITYELRDGLHEVMYDGTDRVICANPMCRFPETARWEVLGRPARERMVFASSQGLLIASAQGRPALSRLTGYAGTGPVSLYIALAEVSLDGERFTLLVNGKDKIFDGARLQGKWQYFIYDIAAGRRLFIAPQFSVNGDVHEALSPSGKKFLTFDGQAIRVYDVP